MVVALLNVLFSLFSSADDLLLVVSLIVASSCCFDRHGIMPDRLTKMISPSIRAGSIDSPFTRCREQKESVTQMVVVRVKTAPPATGREGRMCLNRLKMDDVIALMLVTWPLAKTG